MTFVEYFVFLFQYDALVPVTRLRQELRLWTCPPRSGYILLPISQLSNRGRSRMVDETYVHVVKALLDFLEIAMVGYVFIDKDLAREVFW
jgi:hypothetical protein